MSESTDNNPQCTGCHQLMNPIGYTFETYNHAGFLRADDHGKPPSGVSTLEYMPDPALNGEVSSIIEFSEKLANSDYAKRCFIRQTFRYFMGRDETLADACTLDAMETAYDESGGSFITMIQTLATQDTFLYRHVAEEN
ncbi:MAG: DUF1585 domain-containing protein [bacterium]